MFWDGTRWVDERPTPTPAAFHGPRRLRDWIATIPMVLLVPALLVPFLPAMATTAGPALTVSGPVTAGATIAVKASGFASGAMLQLQWDGSTTGMPTVRTSSATALTLSIRVPSKAKLGTHVLSAVLPVWTQYAVRFGSAAKVSPAPSASSGSSRSSGTLGTTGTLGATTPSHGRTVLASTNVMVVAKVSGPAATATPGPTTRPTTAPTTAPAPTIAPTTRPTTAPTTAPTVAPTAAPTAGSCPANLQAAVNAAPAGATLDETGCSFHERVTIAKSLTLRGATFDGTGLGVPLQQGVLTLSGTNITVSGIRISGSAGAGISVTGSSITVADSSFDHNTQEGFSVSGATNVTFLRDHIAYNNVALSVDPGWEAGGGKAHGTNIVFDGCEADHNGGPGIWFDQWYPAGTPASAKVYNPGAVVRNSRVHDNMGAGIMYEVSRGATIADNVVWHNGSASAGWVWAAGILISSSSDADVYGNLVAWNLDGISVVSQDRADAPGTVVGNSVHDNTVALGTPVAGDSSDKTLLAFIDDWTSGMYAASAANTAAHNAYWSLAPEPQWARFGQWAGTSVQTLAALDGTPIGGASTYLATASLDSLLQADGLPLAP